jgi:hypothetical protein
VNGLRSGGLPKPLEEEVVGKKCADGGAFSLRRSRARNVVVIRSNPASVPVLEEAQISTLCVDVEPER